MKFLTLIDNPWSKKGEIVESTGYRFEVILDKQKYGRWQTLTDVFISLSDYPSIWEPIEEEAKKIEKIVPERMEGWSHQNDQDTKINELVSALNSLTERVKRLEEKE